MQLVTGYADSKSGAHHPVAQGSFPIVVKSAHNWLLSKTKPLKILEVKGNTRKEEMSTMKVVLEQSCACWDAEA